MASFPLLLWTLIKSALSQKRTIISMMWKGRSNHVLHWHYNTSYHSQYFHICLRKCCFVIKEEWENMNGIHWVVGLFFIHLSAKVHAMRCPFWSSWFQHGCLSKWMIEMDAWYILTAHIFSHILSILTKCKVLKYLWSMDRVKVYCFLCLQICLAMWFFKFGCVALWFE